jgi:hypothetical protein
VDLESVPSPLRDTLGSEATVGLLELLDRAQRDVKESVFAGCTDRFERRLVEETSSLRVQIAQLGGSLRQEMARMGADLRKETAQMGAGLRQQIVDTNARLRQDMLEMNGKVRQEVAEMGAALRSDIANGRVELFKWCFLFWIGQVFAIGTLMAVMLRLAR